MRVEKGRLAAVIRAIWILFVIFSAGVPKFLFEADTGGDELEVGRRYVSIAGQRPDGACVLRGIYTTSETSR